MFAPRINYIAIVTCVVFQFVFSMLWYSPWLFGTEDSEALGLTPYLISIVAAFVFTYALFWLLIETHSFRTRSGAKIAFIVWAGFITPVMWAYDASKAVEWQVTLIASGGQLINFVVTGAVLGGWKRRVGSIH